MMIEHDGKLYSLAEARQRGIVRAVPRLVDPDEVMAATSSSHDFRGPDPGCYGCLGTGVHQWAGVPKNQCQCTRWCHNHDRYCEEDD